MMEKETGTGDRTQESVPSSYLEEFTKVTPSKCAYFFLILEKDCCIPILGLYIFNPNCIDIIPLSSELPSSC